MTDPMMKTAARRQREREVRERVRRELEREQISTSVRNTLVREKVGAEVAAEFTAVVRMAREAGLPDPQKTAGELIANGLTGEAAEAEVQRRKTERLARAQGLNGRVA